MLSPRNITFVACRIIALYIFYQSLFSLVSIILVAFEDITGGRVVAIPSSSLSLAINLLAFSAFWYGAGWISARVINDAPTELVPAEWNKNEILAMAITIFGVFTIVTMFPRLFFEIYSYMNVGVGFPHGLVYPFASILFGILLIVGSKPVTNLVRKLRRW